MMKMRMSVQDEAKTYYGHGKLLITGEYFVLDGAKALAVPTKFGQSLRVKELQSSENTLYWVALNNKKQAWLNLVFDTNNFSCTNSQQEEAQRLSKILSETRDMNPKFLKDSKDLAIETSLEFPNEWGLGSSSTLIHCISKWADVDGFKLLQNTIGGSGYDVACAANNSPIIYQLQYSKPLTMPVRLNPPFKSNIYFAYTGKKKVSSEAIKDYKTKFMDRTKTIGSLDRITELIIKSTKLQEFESLIEEHESIIASQLKLMKVKDIMFADYWGSVKSLGAWGGDFVMMTNERQESELKEYLVTKNIPVLFHWNDLVLENNSLP